MTNRLSIIASFVLVTILATGGVELFCRSLDQALTVAASPLTATGAAPAQTTTASQVAEPLKTATAEKSGQDHAIITRRGLFGKVQEKKPEAAPAPGPALEATSLDLTLLGTVSGDDGTQRAIIQEKRKKTQEIYQKNDTVGPALIKEIFRGKVILTVNGKDEVLLMEERKSPSSAGGRARPRATRKNSVVEEPRPIYETVDELEGQPEELELGSETPIDEDELEVGSEEAKQSPAPTRPRRKISFKKKNNQVVEP